MSRSSIQPAQIRSIIPGSIAEHIGLEIGDRLVSINGVAPRDLIDYQFAIAEEHLVLEVLDRENVIHQVELEKDWDHDLGIEFETALFDGLIQCNNACPFCFIDQQPPETRATLHLKDDDYRLSFLYGSYLTLTNLPPAEWDRIARMRLSPLYVSVHATEPEVRSRLLKNPRAGQILDQLAWFRAHRLQIHAQVVVCPGWNDGDHLTQTLLDLASFHLPIASGSRTISSSFPHQSGDPQDVESLNLFGDSRAPKLWEMNASEWDNLEDLEDLEEAGDLEDLEEAGDPEELEPQIPAVLSAAVVPVGLTRFRPSDDPITPVTPAQALAVIDQVQALQDQFQQDLGTTFAWLADEWYLLAGQPIPPADHYEDYPQIGNGVGSLRLFLNEFEALDLPQALPRPINVMWIVGNAVEQAFQPIVDRLNQIENLTFTMIPIASNFWGQSITVTGLLTGQDVLAALQDRQPLIVDALLLPDVMLKDGEAFLDDLTWQTLQQILQIPVIRVSGGARGLIEGIRALEDLDVELLHGSLKTKNLFI